MKILGISNTNQNYDNHKNVSFGKFGDGLAKTKAKELLKNVPQFEPDEYYNIMDQDKGVTFFTNAQKTLCGRLNIDYINDPANSKLKPYYEKISDRKWLDNLDEGNAESLGDWLGRIKDIALGKKIQSKSSSSDSDNYVDVVQSEIESGIRGF